jgi:hypothetical protein
MRNVSPPLFSDRSPDVLVCRMTLSGSGTHQSGVKPLKFGAPPLKTSRMSPGSRIVPPGTT